MVGVHRRCKGCGYTWTGRAASKDPKCSSCGSRDIEQLTAEEFAQLQAAEAELSGDASPLDGLGAVDEGAPELELAPTPSPAAIAPRPAQRPAAPEIGNKDLKDVLKAIGRFDGLTRSLDQRMRALERMGGGNGAATDEDEDLIAGAPKDAGDVAMEDLYKTMSQNLRMMMMQRMVESMSAPQHPQYVPQAPAGPDPAVLELKHQLDLVMLKLEQSRQVEPQLTTMLQQQISALNDKRLESGLQEIAKLVIQTRSHDPTGELMRSVDLVDRLRGPGTGQMDPYTAAAAAGQMKLNETMAEAARGATEEFRATRKDFKTLYLEQMKQQQMVAQVRGQQGFSHVVELTPEQMEQEVGVPDAVVDGGVVVTDPGWLEPPVPMPRQQHQAQARQRPPAPPAPVAQYRGAPQETLDPSYLEAPVPLDHREQLDPTRQPKGAK